MIGGDDMEVNNLELEPVFNTVKQFFENMEWDFELIESDLEEHEASLEVKQDGEHGLVHYLALVDEEKRFFMFYVYCPHDVPEDKVGEIAAFITMANYNMYIGNFELDVEDGETRFKSSLNFDQSEATLPMIRTAISIAIKMMETYRLGIEKILAGDMNPDEAIAYIEGEEEEQED